MVIGTALRREDDWTAMTPQVRRCETRCAEAARVLAPRTSAKTGESNVYQTARRGDDGVAPRSPPWQPLGTKGEPSMTVQLNHTIIPARDKTVSATFLAEILGLADPAPFGHFLTVRLDNDVTLDFIDYPGEFRPQHLAFLVSEAEFDTIFGRIRERQLQYWADPQRQHPGEINHHDGGRGVYFPDPDGHFLEILTRPYGSGG